MDGLLDDDGKARPASGRLLARRYRIGRLLGEGGMAVVYEGEHVDIGKRVAIKIVHTLFAQDKDIVERFKREARSASAVESEHIIQVFDAGHNPEVGFFMVMELLKGEDLAKLLHRQKALDPVFAAGLVTQAAHALEKAHAAGVVHRDLKPANIFLAERDDGSSRVKLVDFGIAKLVRDARERAERGVITRRGTAVGTPLYMSPEQAQGLETVDQRTDIYALGVVLFEAIAGTTPLPERPTYEQMILQLMTTPPARLSAHVPDVPPALDDLVAGMLERDPDARIPEMRTVRLRLEEIYPEIRGSALKLKSVRPPSLPSRLELVHDTQALPLAQTSPAVAVSTPATTRRRKATVAVVAGLFAVAGLGAAAIVKATASAPETVATPAAAPPKQEVTPRATAMKTAAPTDPEPSTSALLLLASPSASSPPAKSAAAPPRSAPKRAPSAAKAAASQDPAAKAEPKSKQVGGAGISQEF